MYMYFHHSSDKSGLKVTDFTFQSAEYWCSYGTFNILRKYPSRDDVQGAYRSGYMVQWNLVIIDKNKEVGYNKTLL